MKMINVNGVPQNKNVKKRIIKWDAKSKSKFQKRVKDILCNFWQYDLVFEEFPVYGSRYTLDFYNYTRRIAVEVQGGQHTKYNPFFHNNNRMELRYQFHKDDVKRQFCEANQIYLLEIFWEEKDKVSKKFIKELLEKIDYER